jgi:hypothetical protein
MVKDAAQKKKSKAKFVVKWVAVILGVLICIKVLIYVGYNVYVVYRDPPECSPSLGLMSVNEVPTIFHKILGRNPPGFCRLSNDSDTSSE